MKSLTFVLVSLLTVSSAEAQSTASPVVTGYLSTSGCTPSTSTPCFVQYGSTGGSGSSVVINPVAVTPTDKGGAITVGGASQIAIAANSSRKGCWIQNPVNATEDLYVSSTAAAATTAGAPDDADLSPGGSWSCLQGGNIIQTDIRVNGVTINHPFIAKETQ